MTRTIALALALASLSACAFVPFRHHHARAARPPVAAPPAEVAAGEPTAGGECHLDLLRVLEGRPGSAVLAAQALDLSHARSIRWVRPGQAVPMDYRPDRLNIRLTHGDTVKSFACG